jgi:hypothetical protein
MKKTVFIAICVLGIVCFSSCRSTSSSCGLANNLEINPTTIQQVNVS